MQDRYVGDAGDYAKYALLRALAGTVPEPLRLGIIWYLFPDEGHNGDGRHIAYLRQPAMATRDPDVHALLAELVHTGERSVAAVEKSDLLPADTLYDANLVAELGSPAERVAHRARWFAEALNKVGAADLLFLDPDNGIETPALKKSDFRAGKYVFWSEIEAAWATGKSLVVYNHLNRSAPAVMQTSLLKAIFGERLAGAVVLPLLFRRGSCRHLWILAQPEHANRLIERTRAFLERGWQADTEADLPARV